jgi:hypothetical protein
VGRAFSPDRHRHCGDGSGTSVSIWMIDRYKPLATPVPRVL